MGISPAGTPPGTFKNRKTLPVTTEIFSIDHVCPLTTRRRAVCVNRENGIPVFFFNTLFSHTFFEDTRPRCVRPHSRLFGVRSFFSYTSSCLRGIGVTNDVRHTRVFRPPKRITKRR